MTGRSKAPALLYENPTLLSRRPPTLSRNLSRRESAQRSVRASWAAVLEKIQNNVQERNCESLQRQSDLTYLRLLDQNNHSFFNEELNPVCHFCNTATLLSLIAILVYNIEIEK